MFRHTPVMLEKCIEYLDIRPEGVYIDGTIGGGGHAAEIYRKLGEKGVLIGLDRDDCAVQASKEFLSTVGGQARLIVVKSNFKHMRQVCLSNGIAGVDGVVLDLGVSSYQLDEAERGFSYQNEALLDMRMDRNQELDASMIVNEYTQDEIKEIIRRYGEERWAARIAAFIIKARGRKRITTTTELVDIIKEAIPSAARRDGPHPAKRTFQALRIAVNDELGALEQAIDQAVDLLKPGGRLCVITFHSLEDRIVKKKFIEKEKPCKCPKELPVCICGRVPVAQIVNRKPILPSEQEIEINPRARSAKLRVLKKI